MMTGVHKHQTKRSGRTGFTLIELLVVISIIAILAGILFPAINRVRARGLTAACASNLRQVDMGLKMYASEYNGRLPPITLSMSYAEDEFGAQAQHWSDYHLVGQYVDNTKNFGQVDVESALFCPADTQLPFSNLPDSDMVASSYGLNSRLYDVPPENSTEWGTSVTLSTLRSSLSMFSKPAQTLAVIDGNTYAFNPGYGSRPPCYGITEPHSGNWSAGTPQSNFNWMRRHGGKRGANMLFLDGHVRYTEDLKAEVDAGDVVFDADS